MGIIMERGIRGGVKRNKARRRIKEMFRRNKEFLQDGFYLFKIKKVSIGKSFSTFREYFFTLLKEGNLWLK